MHALLTEIVTHACYLINKSPSRTIAFHIPKELSRREPVSYDSLRVFGCHVYSFVNQKDMTTLELKSRRCVFLGFLHGVKGFKLWVPESRRVFTSIFDVVSTFHVERYEKII